LYCIFTDIHPNGMIIVDAIMFFVVTHGLTSALQCELILHITRRMIYIYDKYYVMDDHTRTAGI
jgi:hypothetical protein